MITSFLAGSIFGYLYGLLFLQSRRGVPSLSSHTAFAILRFMFLMMAGIYLLVLPSIQPIILVLSFLATFWLMILTHKASLYERNRIFKR
jgi:hypothetical protein